MKNLRITNLLTPFTRTRVSKNIKRLSRGIVNTCGAQENTSGSSNQVKQRVPKVKIVNHERH